MTPHTQHPISIAKNSRLDIFFSRRQDQTMDDAMLLMHQTLPGLEADSNILLINSLCEHDKMASAATRLSRGFAAGIMVYSAGGATLRAKLGMLSKTIAAKNVRMIIVNSWEFATNGTRQKYALADWLREMRDTFKLRVVIYSNERSTPKFGALANLSYAAASTDEVGEWKWHDSYINGCFHDTADEAVDRYLWNVTKSEPASENESSHDDKADAPVAMTMPRKKWQGVLQFRSAQELLGSLTINDLATVSADPLVEADSDYAMAA